MTSVTVTKRVNAPVKAVFASWNNNFGDIYKFNPNLRDSHLLEESPVDGGLGAQRQCDLADGKNWIREKVIKVKENEQIVVDIYEGTMPLKQAVATFDFRQTNVNQTEVAMTMDFIPKMGFLGQLLVPVLKMKFRGMLQSLLDANADYIENGTLVNPVKAPA